MQIFSLLAVSFFGRLQGATQWEGTNANLPAIVRHPLFARAADWRRASEHDPNPHPV